MACAFVNILGYEPDPQDAQACEIWNAAWFVAKEGGFMHNAIISRKNILGVSRDTETKGDKLDA